jgi:hypothetical protein
MNEHMKRNVEGCDRNGQPISLNDVVDKVLYFKDLNRVEVIDESGRAYTNYSVDKAEISFQDDGRTLKIFIKTKKHESNNNI